jgi:hypothetical protein
MKILGIIQGASSGILIIFYAITKFRLVTAAKWRKMVKTNAEEEKLDCLETKLTVGEMSIEQTHLILMTKGPTADEFNMDVTHDPPMKDFGNVFTRFEYNLINIHFFMYDFLFNYYVLYFGISMLGLFSNEIFYCLHLLDVCNRFATL